MARQTKDTGKDQRLVLNLTQAQAEELKTILGSEQSELARKICQRISKTVANREAKALGYARGTKQFAEEQLPAKTMDAIGQAAQEVINQEAI